ncbi:alpha/beta hydrolase family esterase [Amaricoccus macauensis]|uniref:extracellular catalytic domain type 1 short-chain-length polyhydroxyalkanoate depolymerase n=1 Tax=Amaricoccus macauensis TaxID=57001 RepID=UPI003C7DCE75
MQTSFATAMGRALESTRAGDPMAATRIIQMALAGEEIDLTDATTRPGPPRFKAPWGFVEDAEILDDTPGRTERKSRHKSAHRRSLKDTLSALRHGKESILPGMQMPGMRKPGLGTPPAIPEGARYESRHFSCAHGARDYRLYVPASLEGAPTGLVVMLHGCTQDADDFASGTGMNAQAERHGFIVAYPHQTQAHNPMSCWNWFRPLDQGPERGEPALLAALARKLGSEFGIATGRTFCAGLSAGGAMAAILGETHPETFAAVGIHSGLPHGAAHDVVSAFAAMRGDTINATRSRMKTRTIIFHGTADATVHLSNAEAIFATAGGDGGRVLPARETSPGGRSYTRTRITGEAGDPRAELWRIEGAGHAWSGGNAAGSYTDPMGPDASQAMARFFLDTTSETGDTK